MSKDMALKVLGLSHTRGNKKQKKVTELSEDEILGAFQQECHSLSKFDLRKHIFILIIFISSSGGQVFRSAELSRGLPGFGEGYQGQKQFLEESRGQEGKAESDNGTSRKSIIRMEATKFIN